MDLGCGDGRITAKLAEKVPKGKILGIDRSSNMIAEARVSHNAKPWLNFQVMDIKELDLRCQFDFVLSSWAFHHIPRLEKEAVLRRIFVALKSKGSLLITVPQDSAFNTLVNQFIKNSKWKNYFEKFQDERSFFTAQEYEKIFLKIGYREVVINEKTIKIAGESAAQVMASIRSWLPEFRYLRNVINASSSELEEFLHDICKIKIGDTSEEDTQLGRATPYLVIRARKELMANE